MKTSIRSLLFAACFTACAARSAQEPTAAAIPAFAPPACAVAPRPIDEPPKEAGPELQETFVIHGEIVRDDGKPLPKGTLFVELVKVGSDDAPPTEAIASHEIELADELNTHSYRLRVPSDSLELNARYVVHARIIFARLVYVEGTEPVSFEPARSSFAANVTVQWQIASLYGEGPNSGGFIIPNEAK